MADQNKPGEEDDSGANASEPKRDFGDSAGYGSGGSALDRREVGDEEGTPPGPNPLDQVMDVPGGKKPKQD